MFYQEEELDSSDAYQTHATEIEYSELTFKTSLPIPVPPSAAYPNPPPVVVSPFEWSSKRKIFTTCLSCAVTVVSGYAAGSNNAAGPEMGVEWDVTQTALLIGTTTYCVGFALGPMVLAPLSEIKGRKPVFLFSGFLFTLSQIGCAVTHSYPGLLIARFFAGVGSSTFSTIVGGIVADIYHAEDRNTPMAIFAGSAWFGTSLGPLFSGIIAYHLPWRWVFYVQAISCGILSIATAFLFEETRESVILSRNAKALNKWYQVCEREGMVGLSTAHDHQRDKIQRRIRWQVAGEDERASLASVIHLLVTEPIVFWISVWMAFVWGVLYLSFASIPLAFGDAYGFNSEESGAVFTSMAVGSLLAVVLSISQERLRARFGFPVKEAESRLDFVCVECGLFPIGLFIWAWTCNSHVHWVVPCLGVGCITIGSYTIFLAVINYTADTYHRLASSALAAQSLTRNIVGGVFPLVTESTFARMTDAGALSFLGGVGMLLTVVPWVLSIYGPRIRARSKIASEIMAHSP